MKPRLQSTDRAGLQPTEAGPSDEEEPISRTRPGVAARFAVSIRRGPSRGSRLSRHSSRAFPAARRLGDQREARASIEDCIVQFQVPRPGARDRRELHLNLPNSLHFLTDGHKRPKYGWVNPEFGRTKATHRRTPQHGFCQSRRSWGWATWERSILIPMPEIPMPCAPTTRLDRASTLVGYLAITTCYRGKKRAAYIVGQFDGTGRCSAEMG